MGRRTTAIGLGTLLLLGWPFGCRDATGPVEPTGGLIVSDPTQGTTTAGAVGRAAASVQPLLLELDVVYISLPLGTYPGGASAVISNPRTGTEVTARMVEGGLDPVPIEAQAGDDIEIEIRDVSGAPLDVLTQRVPARRPPRVVRTVPPRGKTDVPVNGAIVVVFSEPVSEASLSGASLQLFRGSTPVPGTVLMLQGAGTMAAFVPREPLAPNAGHRLVVTRSVTDLDGDALEAGVATTFVTGTSTVGEPAYIAITTDTIVMSGGTYQLTASVFDAADNLLVGLPMTWSSSDPGGLAVSETGLLTAHAEGEYDVIARVGEISGMARVHVVLDGPAASVVVSPGVATVPALDTTYLTAAVRDAEGHLLREPVAWTVSDPAVTLTPEEMRTSGVHRVRIVGTSETTVTVTARSGDLRGTSEVTITPPVPVASVTLSPPSAELVIRGTVRLTATARDATGRAIGRPIAWRSESEGVATVDQTGFVTAVANGSTGIVATSEGAEGRSPVTVTTVVLRSVSSGATHACALDDDGAAWCWGGIPGSGYGGPNPLPASSSPVRVPGQLRFASLAAGAGFTCGLTPAGAAHCWGFNDRGQLGDGTSVESRAEPAPVTGDHTFTSISAGGLHACGLTPSGAAHCWGRNEYGELGNGSDGPYAWSEVPVPVRGGLAFVSIAAGWSHTCALTTARKAYCWGRNEFGALGSGATTGFSSEPVPVAGDLAFATLGAGGNHSCGITTGGTAYCWGSNTVGQLGDGTGGDGTGGDGTLRIARTPVRVSGDRAFAAIGAGESYTCALDGDGAAFCWGSGTVGQLGDGGPLPSTGSRLSPVPIAVAGGLRFLSINAGSLGACATSTAAALYCWGGNFSGQLGDGSRTSSSVPVKVAGQP